MKSTLVKFFFSSTSAIFLLFVLHTQVHAQKAQMKIDDINTNEDTSITIRKGQKAQVSEKNFEIVSGDDEITGDEEIDAKKALRSWKEACESWKKEIKELNADNKVLILSCGARKKSVEGQKTTYSSKASYRIRVRIRD